MRKKSTLLPPGTVIPNHIAIICDGNRRWARARNLPNFMGHQKGFDATPKIAKACRDFGIHTLSFWAFSTENWDRSKEEIAFLMKKFEQFVDRHLKDAKKDGVRIVHLGRKDRLPRTLVAKIIRAEKETKACKKYILNIALDYGGRDEIIRAVEKLVGSNPKKVDEKSFADCLDTATQPYPYPDLLIRPSGEQRISGMFSWQAAYAELYWLPDHFPSLTAEKLKEIILDFSCRRRRFGGNDDVPRVKFNPKKLAKIEVGWWQAHHKKDKVKLAKLLIEQISEQFQVGKVVAKKALDFLVAATTLHDKKDWTGAVKQMEKYWQLIKQHTEMVFEPKAVADLDVGWWEIHDELEDEVDKESLEKAFARFYGELYRLSELQATKLAHFRAMATFEHDLAEKNGVTPKEEKKHWQKTEEYLVKSYQALREVAS